MKTTLLVENNLELESFLSLNLLTWVGSDQRNAKSAKFAIEILESDHKDIDLIICKSNIITERTSEAIYKYVKDKKLNIPIIIIGKLSFDITENVFNFSSALDIQPIIRAAGKALKVTAQEMAKLSVPEYFPVPIQFFKYLTTPISSIYIQDFDDTNLYNIFIKEFDYIPPNSLKDLASQGTSELFVKKNDRLKFVNNITQEIVSKLAYKDLNDDEKINALEMSQALLQEKISRIGITNETIELAQKNLKEMSLTAKNSSSLKRLLKRLMKNKAGYLFKHSQLLMFVTTHLMNNLDWGNEEQVNKMQFISFFHDIALENDEQAKIHSEAELKVSDLAENKKELVRKHAQIGATVIASYPKAPMGSEMIIKQHHGITHGIGFSETYGANLSPLTIVFILSEDFVDTIIKSGKEFDVPTKISNMREKYPTQRFQKIINTLETIAI